MSRPLCDKIEDDGTRCTSWAIVGYDQCVAHWQPGIGPKRLHAPAYTGPYQEGRFKLEQPVDDEPEPVAASTPESTPEPESVETPAENERPVEDPEPDLPDIIARLLTGGDTARLDAEWDRIREHALTKIDKVAVEPTPKPPFHRRLWNALIRRAA
ncbi:hypothetical protein [Amycolatopsis benzoatilytica]|uniref:hypothetical protein n=1 Tax=Amycolatopsis benzoatilytica TaxID=346045 RepID=UPI00036BEB54|nr:hypothetical protein [Amycolatopsis benzoatilytica]